jgi:hypothetical protein
MPAKKKVKKTVAKKSTAAKSQPAAVKPHILHTNMDHLPSWMIVSIIGGIFLVAYVLYTYSQTGLVMSY